MEMKDLAINFKEVSEEIKGMIEVQKKEIETNGTVTNETKTALEGLSTKFNKLQEHYDSLDAKLQRVDLSGAEEEVKTIGDMFVKSEQYTSMIKSGSDRSDAMEVKLLTTSGTVGNLVQGLRAPIVNLPEMPMRVRDLFGQATTTSNSIEYVRETSFDNQAGVFGEDFTVDGTTEKPVSDLVFTVMTAAVKSIGHWLPVTRQLVEDSSQLASYINSRLIYGLKIKEDDELLNGTTSGIDGVLKDATAYTVAKTKAGDTRIDVLRRAITQAVLAGYPVDGIVLNPVDWEGIELTKADNGMYVWVNVQDGGTNKLWKVPVVETNAIAANSFLVGAFKMGATVWDRQQASVRISDSHKDFFTKNLLAVLAEERLALTVYRPTAFVKGAFPAVMPVPAA